MYTGTEKEVASFPIVTQLDSPIRYFKTVKETSDGAEEASNGCILVARAIGRSKDKIRFTSETELFGEKLVLVQDFVRGRILHRKITFEVPVINVVPVHYHGRHGGIAGRSL